MRTILIEASPWNPATGAVVPVGLAGLGCRPYRHRARNDWRAGVIAEPMFAGAIQYDESGFTGGAMPDFGVLTFSPALPSTLDDFAALLWNGCAVEVLAGDDELAVPVWETVVRGVAEYATVREGVLTIKLRDASGELDKGVASDTFAGTGDLEGDLAVKGRIKRRSFGYCSNVEAYMLVASHYIYEVGDPNFQLEAIDNVKDIGRSATALLPVAWQGTAAATLATLKTTTPPQGGAAVAPSIACLRWWTQPVGPLTVNLRGEKGAGFVSTVPELAQRVIATRSAITVSNVAAAKLLRPGAAGIHFDGNETISQGLDRLLKGSSMAWSATPVGDIELNEITLDNPVEALRAFDAERAKTFRPLKTRKLGFYRNHRIHGDSEISAILRDDNNNELTAGANWSTNLTNRPGELTDGRVPAAIGSGGMINTGRVTTGALVSNAASAPWLASASSTLSFTAPNTVAILSLSVTKGEASSLLEVLGQISLAGVASDDAIVGRMWYRLYTGGTKVAERSFDVKVDGNGTTRLPLAFEQFWSGIAIGTHVVTMEFEATDSGAPMTSYGVYHLRVREYKR